MLSDDYLTENMVLHSGKAKSEWNFRGSKNCGCSHRGIRQRTGKERLNDIFILNDIDNPDKPGTAIDGTLICYELMIFDFFKKIITDHNHHKNQCTNDIRIFSKRAGAGA